MSFSMIESQINLSLNDLRTEPQVISLKLPFEITSTNFHPLIQKRLPSVTTLGNNVDLRKEHLNQI